MMGYVVNEYVIVTGWRDDHMSQAHGAAIRIFGKELVTSIMPHTINQTHSFFVNSSGSKSEWSENIDHQEAIEKFMDWCRASNNYNYVLHITAPEEIEKSEIKGYVSYEETNQ